MLAQLRDVFATEDSAVVPQEDNDGRVLLPQRTDADVTTGGFRQYQIRELSAERFRHGRIVSEDVSPPPHSCCQEPVWP
jgi:hypothetical protein